MASVKLVDVNKSFDGNNMVVNGVNFSIGDGDFLVIVGPSGCGKSTTLNLIAGLDEVTSGQIYINDQLVNDVEPKDRNVSMVFQSHTLGVQGGKVHTRYFIFFLLSIFFIPEIFAQDKILDRPEWKEFFDKHEATGTILIVDSRASAEKVSVYDRTRAGKRYSPASTFKVPHTLFALDAGVVKDEFQVFPWDGVKRGYAPHNQDQNLRSAMRHSALWVYEKFAKAIGEEKARSYLSRISYGNMDPSTKGGAYWVDGKLAISAEEQVVFLKKLYQNDLPFELEHQRLLKDVMIVEAEKDWILRAKTGWEGRHGWWVGWVEWSAGPVFFALNIDTPNRWEDLYKREAIARDILISIRALPPNKSMQPTAKASAD